MHIPRYERKFVLRHASLEELKMWVRLHPAGFRVAFPDRVIHNLYLDTADLRLYRDHLRGIVQRRKYRIRWYDGKRKKAKLEIKMKHAHLGTKESYKLKGFDPDAFQAPSDLQAFLAGQNLPVDLRLLTSELVPALRNRYRRSYYLSLDGQFRLTIDSGLTFFRCPDPSGCHLQQHSLDDLIMEIKYPAARDVDARDITRHFPIRMDKMSKYMEGVERVYF
jgi:SPX domain protein involved in polyphosphate accumulation